MRKVNVLSLAVVGLTAAITAPMVRTASAVTAEPKAIKFGTSLPDALKLAAKTHKPILIDFGAEWCGPCKMIAPILDQIAGEYADKLRIAKLDIDRNPQTPPKYGIRGIPTLILFKNGTIEAQKVGAVSRSQLAAFLDANL